MIISFLNQKGGVGKTTLAVNVAACLAITGHRVLLIDADKQGSVTTWASLREDSVFQVISMARENMARDAIQMATDYDHTIIDGPPHAERVARSCIAASDLVLLPIEPSGLSTWASDLTVQQIQEFQEVKPALKCGFVVSRKIHATVIGRDIRAMAADKGIPILRSEIEQRVGYAEAMTMGKTVFEWLPHSPAVREVVKLTEEALGFNEQELFSGTEAKAANG